MAGKTRKTETQVIDLVERLTQTELLHAGVKPNGAAEHDFRLRVRAFGIMGVQPPRPELDEEQKAPPSP